MNVTRHQLKVLWALLLLLLTVSACGAARAPEKPTPDPASTAILSKLDSRCQSLLTGDEDFLIQAKEAGFITKNSQVLFDLLLEENTYEEEAHRILSESATVQFIDVSLRRASVYVTNRDDIRAVSELSFVRFVRATRRPLTR